MPSIPKKSNLPVAVKFPLLSYTGEQLSFQKIQVEETEEAPLTLCVNTHAEAQKSIALPCLQVRKLKVTEQYVDYRRKTSPLYSFSPRCAHIPQIRLAGKWLEKAGFLMRSSVEVFVSNGLLIIRAVEE